MFKKIGIVGLGLIGGSLARAVKKHDKDIVIAAADIDRAALSAALADGNIDEGFAEISGSFNGCDIVVVCTGAERAARDINEVFEDICTSALLTDVCSVKDFLPLINKSARYIGGHPMAGTEKSGYAHSCAELFCGKNYIITEMTEAAKLAGDAAPLAKLAEMIGAKPFIWADNAEHDRMLGKLSHLPQVVAYLLSDCCAKEEYAKLLTGGGFKDTTRIASSDPAMWTEIVTANKKNVLAAIEDFQAGLFALKKTLETGDKKGTREIFNKCKEGRDGIC